MGDAGRADQLKWVWAHARVSALQDRGCPSGPTYAPNPLADFTGEDADQDQQPCRRPCALARHTLRGRVGCHIDTNSFELSPDAAGIQVLPHQAYFAARVQPPYETLRYLVFLTD